MNGRGSAERGGAAGAAAGVPARRGAHVAGHLGQGCESPCQQGSGDGVGALRKLTGPRGCHARARAPGEAEAALRTGKVTGNGRRQRGACAPTCASCRHPRAARARRCARVDGHTDTRGRRRPPGGREAGARAEGAAAHAAPTPAPTPLPRPHPQDSAGRLPFSSLHTFFFLLLGYMLPWGWLALSCKFPRLTGKQGVYGVGGERGGPREGKSEGGSASRTSRGSPVAALLPQPALGSGSHPPQPGRRRRGSTSEPVK